MSSHYDLKNTRQGYYNKGDGRSWQQSLPSKVKEGQVIFAAGNFEAVGEALDRLFLGNQDLKDSAKHTATQGLCYLVLKKPQPDKDGTWLKLLHCTKATKSRHFAEIARPLPHSSKLWKAEGVKREPLDVNEDSTELPSQTYVIPYKEFDVLFGNDVKIDVSGSSIYDSRRRN